MNAQDDERRSRDEITAASSGAIFQGLGTSIVGLKADEARERLTRFGANELKATSKAAFVHDTFTRANAVRLRRRLRSVEAQASLVATELGVRRSLSPPG